MEGRKEVCKHEPVMASLDDLTMAAFKGSESPPPILGVKHASCFVHVAPDVQPPCEVGACLFTLPSRSAIYL